MSTLIKSTVNDALQIISDWRGETSINSDSNRIRAITRAEQDYASRRFWRTHRLEDQTMSGDGTANYEIGSTTFPMRIKGLTELFVGGTDEGSRVRIVDFNEYKLVVNSNASARVCYEWYDADNDVWKVHINPAPAVTDTITYSYYWTPPTRTTTSDPVICPDLDIIAHLALASIFAGEDEQELALQERQLAEGLENDLEALEDPPAINQTQNFKTNSTNFRGIGEY